MLRFITASALIMLPLYCAAGQTDASKSVTSGPPANMLPDGSGKQVVLKNCQACHSLRTVTSERGSADDWAQTVSQMIGRGANVSDDDADTIVRYLSTYFGPSATKPEEATPPAHGSQPPPSAAPRPAPASADQDTESKALVNVNKAAADELVSRLGLTRADADAIVHYREQNGNFKNLQQFLSVPGIDAEKIKSQQSKIQF